MKNYLSIDIGGTNVKFAHLDNGGKIIEKDKIKTSHDKEEFLNNLDSVVEKYTKKGIKGIGICAPGKIVQTTIHFGGALPFLDGIDFAERYKKYNIPLAVINDGKASVLAESWLGSLKDIDNCAAITLGTGVGGGLIVNGHLLNGVHFQAGELSFMFLNLDKKYFEGSAGFYASAVKMIQEVNQQVGNEDNSNGIAAFKAIKDKNKVAVEIFEKFCEKVAFIILNIQSVVDLDTIAIGGGISAQHIVIDGINRAYDQLLNENSLIKTTLTRPKIVDAKFKNDANLYGALYNLLLHINGEKL